MADSRCSNKVEPLVAFFNFNDFTFDFSQKTVGGQAGLVLLLFF